MSPPVVLVLGAGSIGTRHARNLIALGAEVRIHDVDPPRAATVEGAVVVESVERELERCDGVVVATPTNLHRDQTGLALAAGRKVLVEKPLAMSLEDVDALADLDRVMVGYNLRFHEPLMRLHDLTRSGRAGTIRTARFWFGSYLPDWRPSVDYRTTYSANSSMGGGVLLDAIHELDLVVWWFGPDVAVRGSVVATVGTLDLDVEDVVQAVLQADGGIPVGVSLDYLSRSYRRGVELVGDEATLRFDWQRGEIEVEDASGREATAIDVPVARSYELQAARYLAWLRGEATPPVDGHTGRASLRLAADIAARGA